MKKYFFLLLISIAGFSASSVAQFTDSKWLGTFYIPSENECYLHFKKDTVELVIKETDAVIEEMSYTVNGDTLTLIKIYGSSPCENTPAVYTFKMYDGKLKLNQVSDDCGPRVSAGLDNELTRMKEADPIKKND